MSNSPASLPFDMWLMSKIWKALMRFVLRQDGSFNRRLIDLVERKVAASEKPINGIWSKDVTIDKDTELWVRIFSPATEDNVTKLPVIFYFHGGFFAFLSPAFFQCDNLCRKLAKDCNTIVVSVNYRRIPEHRYPSAIEDCFRAIKWIQSTTFTHLPSNADFSNSFLVGDSAGGNLAHFVSCKAAMEDLSPIVLRGQVLIQPSFGGREQTASELRFGDAPFADRKLSSWRWKAYLPEGADNDHPACNVFGPSSPDISKLSIPPTLVVIGGYCPLQDSQAKYVEGMRAAGKEVEVQFYSEAVHGFFLAPKYHLTLQFHADVCKFIKSRCIE